MSRQEKAQGGEPLGIQKNSAASRHGLKKPIVCIVNNVKRFLVGEGVDHE